MRGFYYRYLSLPNCPAGRVFLALLLVLFLSNSAQGVMPQKLHDYYSNINKAELALLDSAYSSAIRSYNTAFLFFDHPFIKDRYNLAVCYALNSEYGNCYNQLTHVIDKGVSIHKLQQRDGLQDFFKSKFGAKLITYERNHLRTFIPAYRAAIDSLVEMDQKFRRMSGGYKLYGDTIRAIDSMNVIAFNKLIRQYGFPTETRIGTDSALEFNRPLYNVIIIHQQAGSRGRFWDYTQLMAQAADSGYIEIHAAAEYICKSSGNDIYGVMSAGLIQLRLDSTAETRTPGEISGRTELPYGYFMITTEEETRVNQQRAFLGLEPLIEAREKTAFVQTDKRFILPSSTVSVLVCSTREQYSKMESSLRWMR